MSEGSTQAPPARAARSANVTPPRRAIVASRTSAQTSRSMQPTSIGHGSGRTLFDAYDVAGELRRPVYLALAASWLLALTVVVRRHRRDGRPLLNREDRLAVERAS